MGKPFAARDCRVQLTTTDENTGLDINHNLFAYKVQIQATSSTVDISNHETIVDPGDPQHVNYGDQLADEITYLVTIYLYDTDQNDAINNFWVFDYWVGQKLTRLEVWPTKGNEGFKRHWRFDRIYINGIQNVLDVHGAVQYIMTFYNSKFIDMLVDSTDCNG